MKKVLFIIFSLLTLGVYAQDIKWMSMQEALDAQENKPKKIFMDVYTHWCGPCKKLDRETFKNKDLVNYVNKNFYPVKFNAEGKEVFLYQGNTYGNPNYQYNKKGRNSQHLFATALKIKGYPSLVFFDEKSNFIFPITGYYNAQQLEIYLKLVKTDDYKSVTSQKLFSDYENNFKGSFKK